MAPNVMDNLTHLKSKQTRYISSGGESMDGENLYDEPGSNSWEEPVGEDGLVGRVILQPL